MPDSLLTPLGTFCLVNGRDPAATLASGDLSCWLICEWYLAHREAGGERDEVVEQIVQALNAAQDSGMGALQPGPRLPN
jgi:hypothetical protein